MGSIFSKSKDIPSKAENLDQSERQAQLSLKSTSLNKHQNQSMKLGDKLYLSKQKDPQLLPTIGLLLTIHQLGPFPMTAGTGFIVSDNLVLTAAHNVYDRKQQQTAKDIYFYLGADGNVKKPEEQKNKNSYKKQFVNKSEPMYQYVKVKDLRFPLEYKDLQCEKYKQYDYALLLLEKPIVNKKILKLLKNEIRQDAQLSVFGYPSEAEAVKAHGVYPSNYRYRQLGNTAQLDKDDKDQLGQSKIEGLLYHGMPTLAGHSGSPIIIKDHENSYIIGIHTGGESITKVNYGVQITKTVLDNIREFQFQLTNNSSQILKIQLSYVPELDKIIVHAQNKADIQKMNNQIQSFEKSQSESPPKYLISYYFIIATEYLSKHKDLNRSSDYYKKYIKHLKLIDPLPKQALGNAFNNLAIVLGKLQRHEESLEWNYKAKQYFESLGLLDKQGYSYQNIGAELIELKKYPEAKESLDKALAIRKSLYNQETLAYSKVLDTQDNLNTLLYINGEHEEAEKQFITTYQYREKIAKEPNQKKANNLANLAKTRFARGKIQKGIQQFVKCIVMMRTLKLEETSEGKTMKRMFEDNLRKMMESKHSLELYDYAIKYCKIVGMENIGNALQEEKAKLIELKKEKLRLKKEKDLKNEQLQIHENKIESKDEEFPEQPIENKMS